MNLNQRTVLITGGAVRIGACICKAFADAGAYVVIHCHSSVTQAEALLAEIGGHEKGHCICTCDLADPDAAVEMIRRTKPAILVNNASTYVRRTLPEESREERFRQFQVNFHTPMEMIRAMAESLPAGENGAVVNLLDQAVVKTDRHSFSYGISKKMLWEATRSAALAYAPFIRVNAVAPGHVMPTRELAYLKMRNTLEMMPLKRVVSPSDIASAVIFLSKNDSITGETLFVDCGQSLL